jgi:hypothetical protein
VGIFIRRSALWEFSSVVVHLKLLDLENDGHFSFGACPIPDMRASASPIQHVIMGVKVDSYCEVCKGPKGEKFNFCTCNEDPFKKLEVTKEFIIGSQVAFPPTVLSKIEGVLVWDYCEQCLGESCPYRFNFCTCERE